MDIQYKEPVAVLLTLGKPSLSDEWDKHNEFGISEEHVPDLLRMIADEKLNWDNSESDAIWAPVHAWRIIGNLRAAETVQPLLARLGLYENDDWAHEEIPKVLAMIGEPALRPIAQYLANEEHNIYDRAAVAEGLVYMAEQHPELKQDCITRIERQLAHYAENDPALNGFLVGNLLDFKAAEAMPVIQQAYQENCVDESICGDVEDVEIRFGLREKRSSPQPRFGINKYFLPKTSKIGRNDPCPCGSGKKYKKCCLDE